MAKSDKKFDPKFTITNKITSGITKIERARGFLEAANLSKDWITQMQNRALLLEAHHTTHIEGTQLTLDQSEKLLAGKTVKNANPDDKKELLNYRKAFELVSEYLQDDSPITEILVREIHKKLVQDVRGNKSAPGEYRKIQNYVINSKTGETVYTPPPAYEVSRMMQEMLDWINHEENINPILISAISQFQLVHIHPFLDGNGRSARLLSTLCLYKKGYDFKKLFSISEFYDRDPLAYYEAIQSVRNNDMDMTSWIEYFVIGLSTQMDEIKIQGEQVIKTDLIIREYELNQRQKEIILMGFKNDKFTIKDCEKLFPDENRRNIQRDLKELIDKSLLIAEGTTKNRYYKLTN
jgi:Fic family protein